MSNENTAPSIVRFGPFELSVETGELRKNGFRLKLSGQPIKVLTLLVGRPGQLVTRKELQRCLWLENDFGDFETGLNAAVNRLRDHLSDSAIEPKYIETVPGLGYRFIGNLEGSNSEVGPGLTRIENGQVRGGVRRSVNWDELEHPRGTVMSVVAKQRVRFGPFELDTRARELYKRGLKLKLQGHPIDILTMLMERPGDLITREEIQQKLWPTESETFVDFEHGLNTAVRKLRQVLGDEAETPQYIETLPRRGYRFVGAITVEEAEQEPAVEPLVVATDMPQEATAPKPVESAAAVNASVPVAPEKQTHRKRLPMRPLLVLPLVAALIAVGLFLFRFTRRPPSRLVVTGTRQLTYMGEVGGRILTDGRRIYFASTGKNPLRYVSVNGGEATAIPSPVSHLLQTLDISRDGSYLLVKEFYGARGGFEAPVWLLEVNSGAARKLGDIEAQDAAFAPDGKTIVVARDRELYLTDMQGANPLKLAEATGKIGRPRWSPDGQRLRFHVWDGTQALTLWELSQNGVPHQLFKGWKMAGGVCCGEWTADGKYYLFQSNRQYWSAPEHSGLTHSEPTLLTTMGANVITAAPSPLSNTIYVNVEQGSGNVFKWDVDPNHAPSILYQDLKAATLEFSRDGQWVAYSHKAPDGYELWRARADGSDKQQLTTSFIGIFKIRYSPDGSKIAIMAIQNKGRCKVYWVSADGGGLREIPSPITDQGDPAWSPDSQSIMFGLPPEGFGGVGAGVVRRIYLYDLRMGKTTEVPGSANLFNARWSPDGKYVVAVAADFQGMSLLDTTTSKWRPLTLHQPTDYPSWSPDGAWIYFNNVGDTNLSRVRVRDGQVESLGPIPLPSGYSSCSMVAFVADGAALLECGDSRTDVFALDYKEEK